MFVLSAHSCSNNIHGASSPAHCCEGGRYPQEDVSGSLEAKSSMSCPKSPALCSVSAEQGRRQTIERKGINQDTWSQLKSSLSKDFSSCIAFHISFTTNWERPMELLRGKSWRQSRNYWNAIPCPQLVPAPRSAHTTGTGVKCCSHCLGFSGWYLVCL